MDTSDLDVFSKTGIPSINHHYSGSHVLRYDDHMNQMIVNPEGVKRVSSYCIGPLNNRTQL